VLHDFFTSCQHTAPKNILNMQAITLQRLRLFWTSDQTDIATYT